MSRRTIILFVVSTFLLVGGFLLRSQFSARFPGSVRAEIERNLVAEFRLIDDEANRIMSDALDIRSPVWDESKDYFVYSDSTGIIAWTRNEYVPELSAWSTPDEITFFSNQRGDYLIKKWPFRNGYLIHVLTLKNKYHITNSFLTPELNGRIFKFGELEIEGPSSQVGSPVQLDDRTVFHVHMSSAEIHDNWLSFATSLFGLFILLFAVYRVLHDLQPKLGYDVIFVLMVAVVYGIRWGMVLYGLPSLFLQSDIFDPKVFASSSLNASMGDLLLNAVSVLILMIYLFRNFSRMRVVRWSLVRPSHQRLIVGMVCLLFSFFGLLFSYNFIEVIYHNSTQTLDITQSLSMGWVRMVAFLAVLTGTASSFLLIHMLMVMSRHVIPKSTILFLVGLTVAALLFFVQYTQSGNDNLITLGTGLVFFSLLRLLSFDKLDFKFTFRFFIYLIFCITVFGIHHSLTIRIFHAERQVRDQFRYAKDFLMERDVLGEYLLDQARQRIQNDQFIRARMSSPLFSKNSVMDKIRRVHLNSYFDRYELEISTKGLSDSSLQVISQRTTWTGDPDTSFMDTGYPGIFYSGTSSGEAVRRYHVSIPIEFQRPVGSVELDLVLKRIVPDNVFPELLVDNRFSQIYRNRDFSYAIFRGDRLVNSFGSYNYERDFSRSHLGEAIMYQGGVEDHGYFHIGMEETDGTAAVVSAPQNSWSSFITNVSSWFVLQLVVLLMIQVLAGGYSLLQGNQVGYAARIQLFMFLAFALPVVAVSVTTLTLLGRSSEEATKKEFLDRSAGISQRIGGFISVDTTGTPSLLESWIIENTPLIKTDISVYSPKGKLLTTSQPSLFEDHLLSSRMNREAFRKIVLDGERQAVTNEQIGGLQYSCAYAAVLSPQTGRLIAVVSLPFFESATYLQRGQILILASILNVFVMVFLVFSLLSFLAAGSLTFPIRFITRKLRQTTFTGENKPLSWNASDEIGMLVNEYNRMVQNLDESKRALARSEKESAWREMAKQVAHEIKNPLTPMKLTLQQMEQGLQAGDFSVEKSRKSVDVLLRQVEILNAIAASFSTFARMPAPVPQRLDLTKALTDTMSLFSASGSPVMALEMPSEPIWVSVDPTSFSRAMSNILINATQAKAGVRELEIMVSVIQIGPIARLSIRDNGNGIPLDLQEKVFQPQFTTKQSGAGLGLAMTQQIIIQAGGRIWFESVVGSGTTFFVELPVVE